MRRKNIFMSALLALSLCSTSLQAGQQEETNASAEKSAEYTVAAYIWPSCHDDPMGREVLWPEGTGEWEIIKKGNPRFAGHYQPKLPLWGYELDNDPKVMERWIDTATAYGVNTFIFDWYWFNNGPFLEGCLNDGFLKAKNNRKMNFYIMWADHDVARNYWNVHRYKEDDSRLWDGAIDWPNFKIVVERVIRQYFKQPNYFKIDGEPVFSVFSVENLIKTFGSLEETRKGLDYFREEVKKAGFPGLHIQLMTGGVPTDNFLNQIETLGISSLTLYNWGGPHYEDYLFITGADRIMRITSVGEQRLSSVWSNGAMRCRYPISRMLR